MTDKEIFDRVNAILTEEFEINAEIIKPDATIYEALGLDSLDSVDLVVALEKEFSFKINRTQDEETIKAMRKVEDIYSFIKTKLPK